MKILQDLLDKRLKDLGISDREAARRINISPTTVGRILRGESLDVDTLIRVCTWLKVSPALVLDAQLPLEDSLPQALATLIQLEPKLEPVLKDAIEKLERGEINADVTLDILRFALFRYTVA